MRILFIAMPNSIHSARWIAQLAGEGWDLHLFPAYDAPLHQALRHTTAYSLSRERTRETHPSVRIRGLSPTSKGAARIAYFSRRALPRLTPTRPAVLARLISWLKPDLIHSFETTLAGYLTLEAKERARERFPIWIVSTWGSDIYHFGRLREHESRIRAVMEAADWLHADCERDVGLAGEFGFSGERFGVFPVGFALDELARLRTAEPPSARRLVVLKGQQNWSGRALVGLRALALCADALRGYRVVVVSASGDVKVAAELLARETGIGLSVESEWLSHERVVALHGNARISIGLGISDGASVSMLEAMAQGSFPIQSCTACADEWIVDGQTGSIVPPEDPAVVAEAIRRALTDDALVDHAAQLNARVAAERLDEHVVRPQVIQRYRDAAALVR